MDMSWGTDLNSAFDAGLGGGSSVGFGASVGGHNDYMSSSLQQPQVAAPPPPPPPPPPPAVPEAPQITNTNKIQGSGMLYGSPPPVQRVANPGEQHHTSENFVSGAGADLEPGYFEKMGIKKKELIRFICLGLMVALGISIHWVTSYYVDDWIETSGFEGKQELFVRLLYPAGIAFVIWNIKALWS